LIISEFLPNPQGNDSGQEFIEIYNYGEEIINLENFTLQVGNKTIKMKGNIEPEEYFLITNKDDNFSIRNKGETLRLKYKDEVIFEISYSGKAPEGKSFSRLKSDWFWTTPTPGKENKKESISANENKNTIVEPLLKEDVSRFSTSSLANINQDGLPGKNLYYLLGALIVIILLSLVVAFKM